MYNYAIIVRLLFKKIFNYETILNMINIRKIGDYLKKIINYIKRKLLKEKRDKMLKVIFIILGVTIPFLMLLMANTYSQLDKYVSSLLQIEHLNAQTQRLVKLVLLEQDFSTTTVYLEDEIYNLFSPTSLSAITTPTATNGSQLKSDLIDTWKSLRITIESDTINKGDLYLSSDNFHYKINELSILIGNHIEELTFNLMLYEVITAILSIISVLLGLYCVLAMKTDLKHSQALNTFASLDVATGLYNRSKCQDLFKKTSRVTQNISNAILVFDLNDLKKTNDNYGHNLGDELIFSFAHMLQSATLINSHKPFLGRYGGDEFIVFYDQLEDKGEIKYFLSELKMLIENFNSTKKEYQISYAVGYAINTDEELTVRALFDIADEYMYENKQIMKNIQVEKPQSRETVETKTNSTISTDYIDKERVESYTKNRKFVYLTTICICFTMGVIGFYGYINKEYVGGNVLYLSDNTTNAPEDKKINSPWRNTSTANILLYRSLFLTDHTFTEVEPCLAKRYEILDDELTYVITLNDNNYWSDGVPITIDDVVFSIETFLLAENVNTTIFNAFIKIVGADDWRNGKTNSLQGLNVNGNDLTIKLDSNYNLFLKSLTQFVPLPKHILEDVDPSTITSEIDYYKNPIVSGMYVIDGLNEDGNVVLSQNSYYNDIKSNIENVVLVSNYTPLEIDYYATNAISNMVDYRNIYGYVEYPVNVHFYSYFVFNMEGSSEKNVENPIENIKVRKAIITAIDREHLLDTVYFNTGNVMSERDENGMAIYDYDYNPTKARELLEEAEYDFDRPFTIIYYYSDDISLIFLDKVKQYLEDIGLTVELVKSSSATELYDTRDYDMMLKGLSSFSEYDWYGEYLSTNPNLSKVWGTDGKFDDSVNMLLSTNDETEYVQILKDLANLEKESLYRMPLFSLNQYVYIDSNRVSVPKDMVFGNVSYRFDIRFDEWKILRK